MTAKLKLILMGVGALALAIAATLPLFDIWYTVCVAVIFTGGYAIKNKWLPSNSAEGEMNAKDIASGIVIAIIMALSNLVAGYVTGTHITGQMFGITVAGAVLQYVMKTVPSGIKLN